MNLRSKHSLSLLACGLALIGALASSVLPGGFLPKVAGRCGRELCNCAPEYNAPVSGCKWHCEQKQTTHSVRLVQSEIENADAPGSALQFVFSGILTPARQTVPVNATQLEECLPCSAGFALLNVSSQIQTPPPRIAA